MLQTVNSALPCEQTIHVGHFGNKCPKHRAERDHDNMKAFTVLELKSLHRVMTDWRLAIAVIVVGSQLRNSH